MFSRKRPSEPVLGVPLQELEATLAPTTIKASRKNDNTLLAKHEHYTVKVEVVPADQRDSENGPIRAVVQITSELPAQIRQLFNGKEESATCTFNAFAALSALYVDGGKLLNGSRLTIYEEEDSWSTLHLPLLLFTVIAGNEPILGAMRRTFGGQAPRGGNSEWTEQDMQQVESYLSQICVCTTGGAGLTAEFPLAAGVVSAATGNTETALFQLMADFACCRCHSKSATRLGFRASVPNSISWRWQPQTCHRTLVRGARGNSEATLPISAFFPTPCIVSRVSLLTPRSGRPIALTGRIVCSSTWALQLAKEQHAHLRSR